MRVFFFFFFFFFFCTLEKKTLTLPLRGPLPLPQAGEGFVAIRSYRPIAASNS